MWRGCHYIWLNIIKIQCNSIKINGTYIYLQCSKFFFLLSSILYTLWRLNEEMKLQFLCIYSYIQFKLLSFCLVGQSLYMQKQCSNRRNSMAKCIYHIISSTLHPYIFISKTTNYGNVVGKESPVKICQMDFLFCKNPEPKRHKYKLRINLQNYLNIKIDIPPPLPTKLHFNVHHAKDAISERHMGLL